MMVNAVRDDLGIRFRAEGITLALKRRAQGIVIFNDAVVHDRETVFGCMRMRITLARDAVCGPAGMGDTDRSMARRAVERFLECANLADGSKACQMTGTVDHGDTCRIITSIFEPPQPLHEDG